MEEIGLHLMQSNSTCRADRGKNWIFLEKGTCGRPEEYDAGARISAEKEKKNGSTWDFWLKFADLHLAFLSPFFFWFLVLIWVSYKPFCWLKIEGWRERKSRAKTRVLLRFKGKQGSRERRGEKRLGSSDFLAIRTHSDVPR